MNSITPNLFDSEAAPGTQHARRASAHWRVVVASGSQQGASTQCDGNPLRMGGDLNADLFLNDEALSGSSLTVTEVIADDPAQQGLMIYPSDRNWTDEQGRIVSGQCFLPGTIHQLTAGSTALVFQCPAVSTVKADEKPIAADVLSVPSTTAPVQSVAVRRSAGYRAWIRKNRARILGACTICFSMGLLALLAAELSRKIDDSSDQIEQKVFVPGLPGVIVESRSPLVIKGHIDFSSERQRLFRWVEESFPQEKPIYSLLIVEAVEDALQNFKVNHSYPLDGHLAFDAEGCQYRIRGVFLSEHGKNELLRRLQAISPGARFDFSDTVQLETLIEDLDLRLKDAALSSMITVAADESGVRIRGRAPNSLREDIEVVIELWRGHHLRDLPLRLSPEVEYISDQAFIAKLFGSAVTKVRFATELIGGSVTTEEGKLYSEGAALPGGHILASIANGECVLRGPMDEVLRLNWGTPGGGCSVSASTDASSEVSAIIPDVERFHQSR